LRLLVFAYAKPLYAATNRLLPRTLSEIRPELLKKIFKKYLNENEIVDIIEHEIWIRKI